MLCIPNIGDYLKILIGDEEKNFVVKDFREYFKSAKEKLCSELCKEQKNKKVA